MAQEGREFQDEPLRVEAQKVAFGGNQLHKRAMFMNNVVENICQSEPWPRMKPYEWMDKEK